jgi:succinate dehydrogenase / fumarate reductase iron-sulfur subunit
MIVIDGKVEYACTARLEPRDMVLEPLGNKAHLRDLVTEITPPDERLEHALKTGVGKVAAGA